MDCIESAAFPNQSDAEVDRLLHMASLFGFVALSFADLLQGGCRGWADWNRIRVRYPDTAINGLLTTFLVVNYTTLSWMI